MIARLGDFIRRFFVPLAILSLLFGSLSNLLLMLAWGQDYIQPGLLRQYYANYIEFGFAKRALVGTLLYPLFATAGSSDLGGQLLVIGFELAVFASLILLLARLGGRDARGNGALLALVLAAFILSPVGFQQFAWDIGRYDHLNIILLILTCWLVMEGRYRLASALFAIGLLVHEAFFFFAAGPIIVALFARQAGPRDFALCGIPATLAMVAVSLWGNMTPGELALLDSKPGAGTFFWSRGVYDPPMVALAWYELLAIAYYTLLPFVLLYGVVRHNGGSLLRSWAPALITLALYPLGFDYLRWAGLCFVSVAVILIFMTRTAGWTLPRYRPAALALLLPYMLPLGPIGTVRPLYYVELLRTYG